MRPVEFSVFLAGDTMLASPWSEINDPPFLALVETMRRADVAILNLETVIHDFRGFPQADSGGVWCASPPAIAGELAWAGVDMVSHANNHAFDYGCEGLLETGEYIRAAGIALAGSGPDLGGARKAVVREAGGLRVALVGMTATFVPYGRASPGRSGRRGRPGVNPLTVVRDSEIAITPGAAALLRRVDAWLGRDVTRYDRRQLRRFGKAISVEHAFALRRGKRLLESDRTGNLAAIAEGAAAADLTIVSIHSHDGGGWLDEFVGDAVAAGADVVLIHGPHEVRGVEFVAGRPVFHGLGDFAFEAHKFGHQPDEAFVAAGLGPGASAGDLAAARASTPLNRHRRAFEGCAALLRYRPADAGLGQPAVSLLPIDLRFDSEAALRGRPQLADRGLGERLIAEVAAESKRYGSLVRYDALSNSGIA